MGLQDRVDAAAPAPAPGIRLGELLAARGLIAPEALERALARQRRSGARLGEVLRAHGLAPPGAVAEALAGQRRLPFADLAAAPPAPELAPDAHLAAVFAHRALPWRREADGRLIFATPEPDRAAADPEGLRRGFGLAPEAAPGFAVCDAQAFEDALLRLAPAARAARAAARTPRRLSARGLTGPAGRAGLACAAAAVLALAAAAPQAALAAAFLAALALNAVNIALRIAALLAPPPAPPAPPRLVRAAAEAAAPDLAPMISLLVPLYREPAPIRGLIAALEALDWPRERLEVLLALEADDAETAAAIAAAGPPPWIRVIVTPPGGPRTKPRALNHALDFARGAIIGVYDAEDRPDPQQLRRAAEAFARGPGRLACVQARLGVSNASEGWIPGCFAVEYATWFHVMLPGLMRLGLPMPLGGTSLFLRRRALERLGGWDAHNVTEDADLGIRLARAGYLTALIDSETAEEAVRRPLAWIRQRSRWQKGYLFTWLCHMRDPARLWRDLGPRGFLGFQALFLGAASAFLAAPLLWSAWVSWALVGAAWSGFGLDGPWTGPLTVALFWTLHAGQGVMLLASLVALRRAGRLRLAGRALIMPLYWPLGTLSAFKGLAEAAMAPVWWDKTCHGPARRRAMVRKHGNSSSPRRRSASGHERVTVADTAAGAG